MTPERIREYEKKLKELHDKEKFTHINPKDLIWSQFLKRLSNNGYEIPDNKIHTD